MRRHVWTQGGSRNWSLFMIGMVMSDSVAFLREQTEHTKNVQFNIYQCQAVVQHN